MQYQWLAVYGKNEALPQYPREGGENKYGDINRDRLESFVILTVEDKPRPVLVLHIPKDGRLIYRQRVEKIAGGAEMRVWVVGCQKTINGINSQYVAAIFPDMHVEILDGWKDDARWFHPPTVHTHEGETWENVSNS